MHTIFYTQILQNILYIIFIHHILNTIFYAPHHILPTSYFKHHILHHNILHSLFNKLYVTHHFVHSIFYTPHFRVNVSDIEIDERQSADQPETGTGHHGGRWRSGVGSVSVQYLLRLYHLFRPDLCGAGFVMLDFIPLEESLKLHVGWVLHEF